MGSVMFQFRTTVYMSDLPTSIDSRKAYLQTVQQAVKIVLNISADWQLEVLEVPADTRRVSALPTFAKIELVFSSTHVSVMEGNAMKSKAGDSSFIDKLKELGFAVSAQPLQVSTFTANTTNLVAMQSLQNTTSPEKASSQGPSVLVVASSSVACVSVCIAAGLMYFYCAKRTLIGNKTSGEQISIENCEDSPSIIYSDRSILSPEFQAMDTKKQMQTETLSEIDSESTTDTASYTKEIDDILQILSRAEIGIEHILDENLKKQLKSKLLRPSNLSSYDCTAMLQMIAFVELDSLDLGLSVQGLSPNQLRNDSNLLKKSARDGPLTENHLQVLQLLCRPDLYLKPAAAAIASKHKQEKHHVHDTGEHDRQATLQRENSNQNDKEMKESGSPGIGQDSNLPVLKIVELLEKFELQPSYLLHQECREVLEANLIDRQSQGPLSPEQLAILQLLSKAEIDSEMAPSPERRTLLEQRMRQGPLSSSHLGAVADLAKYDQGEILQDKAVLPAGAPADSQTADAEISITAAERPEVAAPAKGEPTVESPTSSQAKTPLHDHKIAELEIRSDRSALLSKEEKARLQRLELKIKTDKIRQSIPEWVRRGLLPPRKEIKPHQPAVVSDSPVLISSAVRADLVYLVSTNPTVSPPKPRDLFHADGELFGPRPGPGNAPGPLAPDPGPAKSELAEVASPIQVAAQATVLAVQSEDSEHAESPETETETEKESKVRQLWNYLCRSFWWFLGRCCSWRSWSSR